MIKQINTIEELINNIDYELEEDINWTYVSVNYNLSESSIEKYSNKVDWHYISECQMLSEEFIEKYRKEIRWEYISRFQNLSENFIEKYKDYVWWSYISTNQILSESFIEKYRDKVYWKLISKSQNLSKEFIKKYENRIDINLYNQFHKSPIQKFNEIQKFAKQNNLYHDYKYIYGYVKFTKHDKLNNFNNKPIIYDKTNYHYKFHWENIKLDSEKKDVYDKLIKININDWITYDDRFNHLYIKGFTIISDMPKKQYCNKYKLLEI